MFVYILVLFLAAASATGSARHKRSHAIVGQKVNDGVVSYVNENDLFFAPIDEDPRIKLSTDV